MVQRTASTHRSSFVRDTLQFHIIGYGAGVASSVRSSAFHVGGHAWALVCGFDDQLVSISLELLSTDIAKDVTAMASLRIDDPHGRQSAAMWRSEVANVFPAWPTPSDMATCRSWKLSLPDAFRGQEASYVEDDGLMIQCTVDVLVEDSTPAAAESVVFVVPPPSISQDLHKLLLPAEESEWEPSPNIVMVPSPNIVTQLEQLLVSAYGTDLIFLVEETEISAHRLFIAARSPILHEAVVASAANKDHPRVRIDDMKAAIFKVILHFIYTDELPPVDDLLLAAVGNSTMVASEMIKAACRFRLERMKVMCVNLLAKSVSKENVLTMLKLARHNHFQELEDNCIEFISLPRNIKDVINSIGLA